MNETPLVYYTHHDLQYVTVHQYTAGGFFHYHEQQGRRYAALVYVEKGKVCFEQQKRESLRAQAGDWVYLPENCRYSSHWEGEEISYYTLDFCMVRRLIVQHVPHVSVVELGRAQLTENILLLAHGDPLLLQELEQIHRQFGDPRLNILATASFYRMWYHVTGIVERRSSDDEIACAIAYIENHLLEPLQLEKLYRLCCMGKSTFFKRFRAATGTSPVQYRNRLLVQTGREMLASGEYTIAQVSDLLGLCSPDYFTVLCKKAEKTTQVHRKTKE